jgi:hypothetical protein
MELHDAVRGTKQKVTDDCQGLVGREKIQPHKDIWLDSMPSSVRPTCINFIVICSNQPFTLRCMSTHSS